jgi:hypothetical protein
MTALSCNNSRQNWAVLKGLQGILYGRLGELERADQTLLEAVNLFDHPLDVFFLFVTFGKLFINSLGHGSDSGQRIPYFMGYC